MYGKYGNTLSVLCICLWLLAGCDGNIPVTPIDNYILIHRAEDESLTFIDNSGDTVIPRGKYLGMYHFGISHTDTLRGWTFVRSYENEIFAIDCDENRLFYIYWFDNGPDYTCDGLFRIRDREGLVGYADEDGQIIIEPQFAYGDPFAADSARVTYSGHAVSIGEYWYWESDEWITINKRGEKL